MSSRITLLHVPATGHSMGGGRSDRAACDVYVVFHDSDIAIITVVALDVGCLGGKGKSLSDGFPEISHCATTRVHAA